MDLTAILVPAVVFYFLYKIIELSVRKKERLLIIEKWQAGSTPMPPIDLTPKSNGNLMLRVAGITIGVAVGLLVGILITFYMRIAINEMNAMNPDMHLNPNAFSSLFTSASTLLFGGIGALVVFFIERKLKK